ncbi:MAG: polyhydroxyalkanoate synthesis regulator DNA-binding domain-containing protein [Holophagales bacterium]|nr:polyhydroxyalkanoate synthesis regulator DNA-binding domain-containing protein [Holophagales bacterium]
MPLSCPDPLPTRGEVISEMLTDIQTDLIALRESIVTEELELLGEDPILGRGIESRRNTMIRVIKRYESRKLYDTEESRYISLEDITRWVRDGQDIQVIDNATSEDVTAQVLTQIILDEGKRGTSFLPTELLHELVRAGEKAVSTGVEQVQERVDRLLQKSIDRLAPVRRAREEMAELRDRLGQLERTLEELESHGATEAPAGEAPSAAPRRKTASRRTARTAAKAQSKT